MKNQLAKLESQIDHLETELSYLNELLIRLGFDEGISTLKAAAEEILQETQN
ncbi:MAG: hypothetical protein H7A40_02980 [Chlamydiales bacterium]|nr:hypothetical protein [Chlamydiales bacterium]